MVTHEMESFHFAEWMSGNCSRNALSKDAWQSVRFDVSVRDQHEKIGGIEAQVSLHSLFSSELR